MHDTYNTDALIAFDPDTVRADHAYLLMADGPAKQLLIRVLQEYRPGEQPMLLVRHTPPGTTNSHGSRR